MKKQVFTFSLIGILCFTGKYTLPETVFTQIDNATHATTVPLAMMQVYVACSDGGRIKALRVGACGYLPEFAQQFGSVYAKNQ